MKTKIRKTFPKMREFFKDCGITLTYEQIAKYARKDSVTRNDVLKYDCTDTMTRDYMLHFLVTDILGKGYEWPTNGRDAEWSNLFYEKFFLTAHEKGFRVDKQILKLAQNGIFRKRAEAHREATRFK
jgi:hypothetical protein